MNQKNPKPSISKLVEAIIEMLKEKADTLNYVNEQKEMGHKEDQYNDPEEITSGMVHMDKIVEPVTITISNHSATALIKFKVLNDGEDNVSMETFTHMKFTDDREGIINEDEKLIVALLGMIRDVIFEKLKK